MNEQIRFGEVFQVKHIDENGNAIIEDKIIKTDGVKAGKGHNAPLIVSYDGITGYYKNSTDTSTAAYDHFEYVICGLGKKLGISMAETYKLFQDGKDIGIISESVNKPGDISYDMSSILELRKVNSDHFPIDTAGISSIVSDYVSLNVPENMETFVDQNGGSISHEYIVLKTPADIEQAIIGFPKLVSLLQVPDEQKENIEQAYYDMLMLDLITGNVDRNRDNYGLTQRSDGRIEFSPLYDNSTIVIPHLPEGLTQVNGYFMNRDRLLECLYEKHYDRISHITTELYENRQEYEEFLHQVCGRDLEKSESGWLLGGHIDPQIEKICKREELKKTKLMNHKLLKNT